MGDPSATNDLQNIYTQYKNDSKLTSSNVVYKVALDNYFNDKIYALNQINDYRKVYKSRYDIQNLDAAEEFIKSVDKDKVLFVLFNIGD